MRAFTAKSLFVLAGLVMPFFGTASPVEAGVIPWLYDSIFGYGWGGHGYGGGGGMPYSVGYGGYGSGYAAPVYSSPTFSAPIYSSPGVVSPPASAPAAPLDGTYNALYGPSLSYYGDGGYTVGYGSGYASDGGSCCVPCAPCATGDCGVSTGTSSKPASPTPVDETLPVTPNQKKSLPPDDMSPAGGVGTGGTDEALPPLDRGPTRKKNDGAVPPDDMERPIDDGGDAPPAGGSELGESLPGDRNIAVRHIPMPNRARVTIPKSTARVVRVDRSVRVQLVNADAKPQLAAKD